MTPRSDRYAFVCGHTGGIVVGEQSRCRAVDEVYRDPKLTFGNPAYDRDNSLTGQDFRQYKSLVARVPGTRVMRPRCLSRRRS